MSAAAPPSTPPTGRLAPSPTGQQHLGNARTYLLAWLSVRARGGRIVLRLEDLDDGRSRPEFRTAAVEDLNWLGLDWDEGPDVGGPHAPYLQTERLEIYRQVLDDLRRREFVFPCTCRRADLLHAAGAPHAGDEGPIYPGTCRHREARQPPTDRPYVWRFRLGSGRREYLDGFAGPQARDAATDLGDFVLAKADGTPAYQLAVTVDDIRMGVTEVVRGDDLIPSTFRQRALYAALDAPAPAFLHVPLVFGTDGRRLAKRQGSTRLSELREQGISASAIVGRLAWSCGLRPTPAPVRPRDLLADFAWERVPRQPFVWDDGAFPPLG